MVEDVLSSPDRIHGIQGVAEAGKTTTLAVIRCAAEVQGYETALKLKGEISMREHECVLGLRQYPLYQATADIITFAPEEAFATKLPPDSRQYS